MKNKNITVKGVLLFFVLLAVIASMLLPIPYYIEGPGTTENLKDFVTVAGTKDTRSGGFYLTTVGIHQATVFTALKAKLEPFSEVITREELLGGSTDEEYNRIQRYYMESSQNAAIEQALKLAGKDYSMEFLGVYVLAIEKNSNFKQALSVGDTVTQVDGQAFKDSQSFIDYVKSQKVGQEVTITYKQDDETKEASGKLIELPTDKKPGIGITLTDHTKINSSVPVTIDAGSIGGPSAGLMFTLETYEQLSGKDLRKGYDIAGTGTMNSEGVVGRIGGIDKKIVTASKNGADIFFAPDDELTDEIKEANPGVKTNYEEAVATGKKIKTKMKIVPVKTVQDALDYLEKLEVKE